MSVELGNETDHEVDLDEIRELCGYVLQEMHVHPGADLYVRVVFKHQAHVIDPARGRIECQRHTPNP